MTQAVYIRRVSGSDKISRNAVQRIHGASKGDTKINQTLSGAQAEEGDFFQKIFPPPPIMCSEREKKTVTRPLFFLPSRDLTRFLGRSVSQSFFFGDAGDDDDDTY